MGSHDQHDRAGDSSLENIKPLLERILTRIHIRVREHVYHQDEESVRGEKDLGGNKVGT